MCMCSTSRRLDCAHFIARSANHFKVLSEAHSAGCDDCSMESGLARSVCGQAEAAGRAITPERRNATQLCGLEPESGLFGTLPFPGEQSRSCSRFTPFFPASLSFSPCNLLNMCLEVRTVYSVASKSNTDRFINGYWEEVVSKFDLLCSQLCRCSAWVGLWEYRPRPTYTIWA